VIVEQVKDGETFEEAYKRFKRACERDQLFAEIRRHEFYEKPSKRKKRLKGRGKR
jgi:small subunit ribosomal protein S21